jgi:hypothetical protein
MKAFSIFSNTDITVVDVGPDHFLPDVRCRDCGEEWGAPWFSFPTINPPWINDFPCNEEGDNPVVSWQDFLELSKRLCAWDSTAAAVIPGSSVGPLSGTAARGRLPEILCDGSALILSMAVIQHLRKHGMKERFAPASIRFRGKLIKDRYAVEAQIVNALIASQRRDFIRRSCATCGFLDLKPMNLKQARSFPWKYDRDVIADVPFFFVARETGTMVFTEAFVRLIEPGMMKELDVTYRGEIL